MTTDSASVLDRARDAARRRAWEEAATAFTEAAEETPLAPADLEALADAAWWSGNPDQSTDAMEQAYTGYVAAGDVESAARVAILMMVLAMRRLSDSVAAGWRAKAERLLEGRPESANHAGLKMSDVLYALFSGDLDTAIDLADETIEIARRTGDHNTESEALVFKGRALVGRGAWREGIALIDEAAATALSGSLGLRTASNIYCCTIEACRSIGDFRRAGEWTEEADRWMHRHSVGGYTGVCQIRRAELKRLRGDWPEAEVEAVKACELLARYRLLDEVGLGEVQIGLIQLHMGEYDEAEATFARAFEHGADPQPGLALLMVARGRLDDAARSLERSLGEVQSDLPTRMLILPVQVRVAVARGDLTTARKGVDELESIAAEFGRPAYEASAFIARGELELGEGRPGEAIEILEKGLRLWRELDFPFESAQTRALLARAHLASGDKLRARMELDAARSVFQRLGAKPALSQTDELIGSIDRASTGSERTTRALMFTDIVTSTDLIGVIGDEAWESLIAWHDRELRAVFADHDGVEANHAGDGFFVVFETADQAISAAVAIQRKLADHRREHGFAPSLRIGVHTAEATLNSGEYRGQGVHVAARVGATARGGEIVVSSDALESVGRLDLAVTDGVPTDLKGVAQPVVLHTVDWR